MVPGRDRNPSSVTFRHCWIESFHSSFCTMYRPPDTETLPNWVHSEVSAWPGVPVTSVAARQAATVPSAAAARRPNPWVMGRPLCGR